MEQGKAGRVIEIVKVLQGARNGLSIREIADRLGLEYKTQRSSLKRDIDDLSTALHITDKKEGKTIKYSLLNSNINLEYQNSDLFTLGEILKLLAYRDGVEDNPDIIRFFEKIDKETKGQFNQIASLYNHLSMKHYENDTEYERMMGVIFSAIENQHTLVIEYDKDNGSGSETRIVEPYIVRIENGNKYLVAYCCKRNDYRVFKTGRIKSLKKSKKFRKRVDFDPEKYFANVSGIIIDKPVRVVIRADKKVARYFKENKWGSNAGFEIVEEVSEYIIFAVTVSGTIEIRSMVQSFIPHCEVVEPVELREEIMGDIIKYIETGSMFPAPKLHVKAKEVSEDDRENR